MLMPGFLYRPDPPRPETDNFELVAEFSPFSFNAQTWLLDLGAVFPLFDLAGFEIKGQQLRVVFPAFEVELTALGGSNLALDASFASFSSRFTFSRGFSFSVPLSSFEGDFALSRGDQTLAFTAPFAAMLFEAFLQAQRGDGTDYEVWVLNQRTGAHSTYSSWPANSYGRFNGVEVVAMSDGIYSLDGEDDAGTSIEAKIHWAETDLGTTMQKRIESLAANVRNLDSTDLRFLVVVDEQEARYYTKPIEGRPEGMRRHRQKLPRGLEGQGWQFGLENQSGGELVVDDVEVLVIDLSRQFK